MILNEAPSKVVLALGVGKIKKLKVLIYLHSDLSRAG